MYGLAAISNFYTPDGTGRDRIFVLDPEVKGGRTNARPYRTACLGRQCHPPNRVCGPKPPSSERVEHLVKGKWKCSGQWADTSRSASCIPYNRDNSIVGSARAKYEAK